MKWYALYADGELIAVRRWYGTPKVRDFGVCETPSMSYEIRENQENDGVKFVQTIPFTPAPMLR